MPVLQANIIEGRSDEMKERLIEELTEACVRALDAPRETVRVIINEMPKQNYGIGGDSVKKLGR
ncbi:MAG: 2-hydroxymuconate tautomerase [Neptuniibacter sp.]|uniref:2-hydroxymuconate tautomerase n=1 Tax=Neptuniibacter sp. TaxID=1962643 RepID=UPI003B5C206D